MYQNGLFCTLTVIIRDGLCEGHIIYTNPLLSPFPPIFCFTPINGGGGGAWAPVPPYTCSYASDGGI